MKTYFLKILPLLFITNIFAFDAQNGKQLFNEAECMSCHNDIDFHKNDKKVNNFQRLHKAVQSCQFANDVPWFDDETKDVSEFLNLKYYKFKNTNK